MRKFFQVATVFAILAVVGLNALPAFAAGSGANQVSVSKSKQAYDLNSLLITHDGTTAVEVFAADLAVIANQVENDLATSGRYYGETPSEITATPNFWFSSVGSVNISDSYTSSQLKNSILKLFMNRIGRLSYIDTVEYNWTATGF